MGLISFFKSVFNIKTKEEKCQEAILNDKKTRQLAELNRLRELAEVKSKLIKENGSAIEVVMGSKIASYHDNLHSVIQYYDDLPKTSVYRDIKDKGYYDKKGYYISRVTE